VQALQQSAIPGFAGGLIDDPLIAQAGASLTKSREGINAPQRTAGGLYLPGEGEFIEDPAWAQEQEQDRGTQEMYNLSNILSTNQRAEEANQTRGVLASTNALMREAEMRGRREDNAARLQESNRASKESADIRREGLAQQAQLVQDKLNAPKPVPATIINDANKMAGRLSSTRVAIDTWKDTHASALGTWTAEQLDKAARGEYPLISSIMPKSQIDAAEWFGNFKRYHEAPERLALFGATLTNNELADWKNMTIPRGMPSDQVKQRLAWIKYYDEKAMKRYADIMATNWKNPEVGKLYYPGWFEGMADPTPPEARPSGMKTTGGTKAEKPSSGAQSPASVPATVAPKKTWVEIK
jgi:hypothetical protein